MFLHGKKSRGYRFLQEALILLFLFGYVRSSSGPATKKIESKLLHVALRNVQPILEVRKVRVAGKTFLVPSYVSKKRSFRLAIQWILEAAKLSLKNQKKRILKSKFQHSIAIEIALALQKKGGPRKKREKLHQLADANRSFHHYRWWN
uniref:Ribosomal protein S7 n=1 Tax=Mesostigma viride TaxID=41882 RepID=Q8W9Q5_MESVI|nr:ribosomal protein S7 [Mesostigma viride]AAL36753.1 ribosomal protein S7 [Mesostigma viride]